MHRAEPGEKIGEKLHPVISRWLLEKFARFTSHCCSVSDLFFAANPCRPGYRDAASIRALAAARQAPS